MRDAVGRIQSVLVLGGYSDIALSTIEALGPSSLTRVMLAGRDPVRLREARERLLAAGATDVTTAPWDASDIKGQVPFIDSAFEESPDFDVVLLAAGILGDNQELERDPVAAVDTINTNFAGAAISALSVAANLRRQGHGTLAVLSSIAAVRPRKSNYIYGSTKAGIDFLARGLAASLEGSGAKVIVVRPGFVHTKMTEGLKPVPFSTDAPTAGKAIAVAIQRDQQVVWVPSVLRWVALIFRHLPRFVWRRVEALEK